MITVARVADRVGSGEARLIVCADPKTEGANVMFAVPLVKLLAYSMACLRLMAPTTIVESLVEFTSSDLIFKVALLVVIEPILLVNIARY